METKVNEKLVAGMISESGLTELTVEYMLSLMDAQNEERSKTGCEYIKRVEAKDAIDTIWIPVRTGNRCAMVNLNHELDGFSDNNLLWGRNGNCDTPYVILPLPKGFIDKFSGNTRYQKESNMIAELSERVRVVTGKPESVQSIRLLRADESLPVIFNEIITMAIEKKAINENLTPVI